MMNFAETTQIYDTHVPVFSSLLWSPPWYCMSLAYLQLLLALLIARNTGLLRPLTVPFRINLRSKRAKKL